MTCATCRWWKGDKHDYAVSPHFGECRLYPPSIGGDVYKQYPVTEGARDWCGQHSPLTSPEGLSTMPPSPTGT